MLPSINEFPGYWDAHGNDVRRANYCDEVVLELVIKYPSSDDGRAENYGLKNRDRAYMTGASTICKCMPGLLQILSSKNEISTQTSKRGTTSEPFRSAS
jgi:hypothetical protein